MPPDEQLLFETYKLQTELAERVASLREGLNKLYSGMVTGIVAASVLLHRLLPDPATLWPLPTLGILVSLSWMFSFHSVTGRLSAKHEVLLLLEEELPFRFLDKENRVFNRGRFIRRKYSAIAMPTGFLALNVIWFIFLITQKYC